MRRTVPLLITAIVGFTLILSAFLPWFEPLGEMAAIWFDLLAAVAFVLGGGNLLKIHLRNVAEQKRGWAYSVVTLVSFLITLIVGVVKFGAPPAPAQEFRGETFAELPIEEFPLPAFSISEVVIDPDDQDPDLPASIPLTLPTERLGELLPLSVRGQASIEGDEDGVTLSFQGWMTESQAADLKAWGDELVWKVAVEQLQKRASAGELENAPEQANTLNYYGAHEAVSISAPMTDETREWLVSLGDDQPVWTSAVDELQQRSNVVTSNAVESYPLDLRLPENSAVNFAASEEAAASGDGTLAGTLSVTGPMSTGTRDALKEPTFDKANAEASFRTRMQVLPPVLPFDEAATNELIDSIEQAGPPLTDRQREAVRVLTGTVWKTELLAAAIESSAGPTRKERTVQELLTESLKAPDGIVLERFKRVDRPNVVVNEDQRDRLRDIFSDTSLSGEELFDALDQFATEEELPFAPMAKFLFDQPSRAEFQKTLGISLLKAGPLSDEQQTLLFAEYVRLARWSGEVDTLYLASQQTKYPLSGDYRANGSPFNWIYEYLFKPLTATMFAVLAFYVASAAFRAFRAKNVEALLLLGTAFVILIGRVAADKVIGKYVGLPDGIPFLEFDQITIFVMQVFNTAGNRAIMIGIALGIVSTSLKVLLGIDRSYLGGGD